MAEVTNTPVQQLYDWKVYEILNWMLYCKERNDLTKMKQMQMNARRK